MWKDTLHSRKWSIFSYTGLSVTHRILHWSLSVIPLDLFLAYHICLNQSSTEAVCPVTANRKANNTNPKRFNQLTIELKKQKQPVGTLWTWGRRSRFLSPPSGNMEHLCNWRQRLLWGVKVGNKEKIMGVCNLGRRRVLGTFSFYCVHS
jgi:hypothetical protein